MKVELVRGKKPKLEKLIIPVFQEARVLPREARLDSILSRMAGRALSGKVFRGEVGESLLLLHPSPADVGALVLLGLGPEKKLTLETLRRAAGILARRSTRETSTHLALEIDLPPLSAHLSALGWEKAAQAITVGWNTGGYVFDAYKSTKKDPKRAPRLGLFGPSFSAEEARAVEAGIRAGQVLGDASRVARDLANTPGNDLYPEKLAEHARVLARRNGLAVRILHKRDLEREHMGALLGVAQGSDHAPCMIVLDYRPRRAPKATVVLVGKAVTFDSGGLSIKPAKGMEEMKFDMSGGAIVLGALQAIASMKPPLRVVGIVPSTENLISGSAMRPGDILRSAAGKTIEVVNTDAEGRLILADALHYARKFRPDYMVDFATLTGACLVALGTQVSGLVTNNTSLGDLVFAAGEACGERVWKLPLYDEFLEATKSTVADLKNSAGRSGGAITAAAFLSHFVGKTPWCHVDIAGTAWAERDSGPLVAGATGVGLRLAVEVVSALAARPRGARAADKA
ncbi:MAG TPA: leucyl aminopeptidase [Planctomycetota bacterium]|nr:leucyl aminopeptidase [Planctomycetota bacterium]